MISKRCPYDMTESLFKGKKTVVSFSDISMLWKEMSRLSKYQPALQVERTPIDFTILLLITFYLFIIVCKQPLMKRYSSIS